MSPPPSGGCALIGHGTSLESARCVAPRGINRGDWAIMHFYACDRNGNSTGRQRVNAVMQEIAIIASNGARDSGIKLDSESNDVILSGGIDGVIPPR